MYSYIAMNMLKSLMEKSVSRELLCQSCGEQKMSLQRIKSSLIKEMELTMCATCIGRKYEPRFIIIIAIRSPESSEINHDLARKVIKEQRYIGNIIPASDIL